MELKNMPKNDVLKARAEMLAKPMAAVEVSEEIMEILVFQLANEQYAIETQYLNEVYPLKDYTPLPCTPAFIYGITNVRRKILAIIDLRVIFSLPHSEDDGKKIVILSEEDVELALLIDTFSGIRKVPINTVQTSLPTLTGVRQEFLKGILLDGTVVLDGKKILTSKLLIVDQAVEL